MRELSDEVVRDQAQALADYLKRGGDETVWLASKFFTREDAYAVRQELRRSVQERVGRGA